MSDQQLGQHQETYLPSTNAKANESKPSAKVERIKPLSNHQSTGPRTPEGKQKSKFNALKHGILSKAVLLKGESRAEYKSLLDGLRDDYEPEGTMENLLVEHLAVQWWRRRRLLQVESAEISKRNYLEVDTYFAAEIQTLDYALRGKVTDGRFDGHNNLATIQEALNRLNSMYLLLSSDRDDEKMGKLFRKLMGIDQDGAYDHHCILLMHEVLRLCAGFVKGNEQTEDPNLTMETVCKAIKLRMEHLTELYNIILSSELQKIGINIAAAGIPSQEVSERLLRYESQLGRELERTQNQLERLQRMRKGHPAPRIDITLSS